MSNVLKRLTPSRLGIIILLYFLVAFAAAAGIYFALDYFSNDLIDRHYSNSKAAAEQTEQELDSFESYVVENNLSTSNSDLINNWINGEKYVLISIYKNNYLVYSNYPGYVPAYIMKNGQQKSKYDQYTSIYQHLYEVNFSDGVCHVGILTLAALKVYNAVQTSELIFSFACFVVVFLMLLSSKFRYINKLQNEMAIIGSGNLELPVTVKGNDEIAYLARSIDDMRKSFLERIKSENEAREANSELITSISHDLRTPLTILMGNIDVIADKKYKSEEQYERYIEICRKKAYQIKELSDKLFEYFLVSGRKNRELEMTLTDGSILLEQMTGEYALSLKDQGFTVNVSIDSKHCLIDANLFAVRRVFDNLFRNIDKYAPPGSVVDISIYNTELMLFVIISNVIEETPHINSSTNIGLSTCVKIMSQHHGTFTVETQQGKFIVIAGFPIKKLVKQ